MSDITLFSSPSKEHVASIISSQPFSAARSHVISPPLHSQTRPFYLYTPPSPSSNSNSGSLPLSNFSKFPSTKSSSAGSPPLQFSSFPPPPPPAPITSSPRKSQSDVNWFSLIPFNSPLLPSEQSFPPPPTASPRISSTSVSNSPPNRPSPSYLWSSSPAPTRTPVKQLASPWLPETPEPSLAISPPPKQIYPPILSQFVPSIRPPNLVSQPTPPPPTHSSQTRPHVPPSRFDSNHSEIGKFTPLKDGIGSVLISIYALVGLTIILVITLALTLSRKNKKRQIMNSAESYRHDRSNSSPIKSGYIYNQASETNPSGDSNYRSIPGPEHLAVRNSSSSYTTHGFELGYVDPETGNSVTRFTFEELVFITNGFSSHNLLGEGGFGYVYKGRLPNGREVTVKQLKFGNWQSELEFKAEVEIISHIHYNHLVSLVGYCIVEQHRFLVHEFVPNGSLEYHLHEVREPVLDWPKRIKIAIGAAKGLAYLHEDCHPWIIHQDIKSTNILLDDSFEAKIADFGLTNFLNVRTRVSVHDMGTLGYMAPEYTSAGKLTDRSDVFSFGVVLLELITGCKPIDPSQSLGGKSLVERARPLLIHAIDTGAFEGLVDPRLENNYAKNEMVRMMETAAACVRHSAPKRPRMVQVAQELESLLDREEDLPDASNGVNIFQSHNYNPGIQINHHMPYSNSGDSVSYASNQNLANNSELNPMTHHGLPTSCTSGDSQKSSSSEWITLDCHERMNQA